MRKLHVRPRATLDVEESSLFYFIEGSESVSARFETAVVGTYAWILENPKSGALRSFLSPGLTDLRMRPVQGFEKHLVFYRTTDDGVEIVRVLHGARDIDFVFETDE